MAACALALAVTSAPAATLVVYGDSLSAGYGLPREQGWVDLLAQRLRAEKFDYKVVNASISGETTLGGRNRLAGVLGAHRPAVLVLALGANDGLRGSSLDAMRRNLEATIDAARRAKVRVLLIGMRIPPNYGKDYTEKFQSVFREVARARKVPLVPFLLEGFADNREYFQPDGIHPTAAAQPLMLETVWKGLRPLLKKTGKS